MGSETPATPTGIDLDREIAVRLFGAERIWEPGGSMWWRPPPRYSSDIAAAWLVLERLTAQHISFALIYETTWHERQWQASVEISQGPNRNRARYSAQASTPPEAICRLALLVVDKPTD